MMGTGKWLRHEDLAIRTTHVVRREEYLDFMTFRRNDRPLFTEIFGPLVGLKEEWEEQGASPAELDLSAFRFRSEERRFVPVNTGRMGGCPESVIEETDEHILSRDGLGRTMQLQKGVSTLPHPLDYPVRTMEDWLRIKPLYEYGDARFSGGWEEHARRAAEDGAVVCAEIPGGFDEPRQLMGEENLCIAFYEQPDLVHDILATIGETAFRVLERVTAAVPVDALVVHEDMAGKGGPLAGPVQVREFIRPYYRRIWDMMRERGTRLFDQDSDGDMRMVIPSFIDAGVNCMHPMEPAAGMDIVHIRRQYGNTLALYGGIDKHVLRRSTAEITAELEYKIPPMAASGGCVLGLDHRIPNGTPLENYRFYIRKAWEIMERAPTGAPAPRSGRSSA
jgi:hypothetical protein